jgi:acyl-CoA synthetase (AMP-forming)/AMP-acid ligase II
VPWIEVYGPTEATITATTLEFSPALEHDPRCRIGRPIANTKVYVVDRLLQPVPIGVPGELVIGGVGVAAGYHARPALTSAQFIADPFDSAPGARLYRTGDRARWLADGSLEYLGRTDDQVKIRGIRIELGDVEAALSSHPAIARAVVAVRDSAGDNVLVGYYVARQEPAPSPDDLRRFLVARIPPYLVPSIFLPIEEIPLSPNGKADRKALPAPQRATANNDPPHGETERAIAEVWSEMLGVARPGRSDHFFELGGHSLLASRVAARLSDRLGVRVPLRTLFEQPILSELAHWLSGGGPEPSSS